MTFMWIWATLICYIEYVLKNQSDQTTAHHKGKKKKQQEKLTIYDNPWFMFLCLC